MSACLASCSARQYFAIFWIGNLGTSIVELRDAAEFVLSHHLGNFRHVEVDETVHIQSASRRMCSEEVIMGIVKVSGRGAIKCEALQKLARPIGPCGRPSSKPEKLWRNASVCDGAHRAVLLHQ